MALSVNRIVCARFRENCRKVSVSPKSFGRFWSVVLLVFCASANSGELYVIVEDDTVFVGSDFEYYDTSSSELGFTEAGAKRWATRSYSQIHEGSEIPKLSQLTGQEFIIEIEGEVVTSGHFSSMLSSRWHPELVIWDSFVRPGDDSIRLSFELPGTDLKLTDPRESEAFLGYFRSRGKGVDSKGER